MTDLDPEVEADMAANPDKSPDALLDELQKFFEMYYSNDEYPDGSDTDNFIYPVFKQFEILRPGVIDTSHRV